MYSSPHLIDVRERIRINNQPISEDEFTSMFWDVHDQIAQKRLVDRDFVPAPSYLMYLNTMAFKMFIDKQVWHF